MTTTTKLPFAWGIHDVANPEKSLTRASGCGYYRIQLPLDHLGRHGWDTRYASGTPPAEADAADILVGQRLDRAEVTALWRRKAITAAGRKHKLVYELDDDVWHTDPIANQMAHRVYGNPCVQDSVEHCAQVSDLVTVSTPTLGELLIPHNRNVVVLPNCIPQSMLTIERPKRDHVIFGWGGGNSHGWDLAMIAMVLRKFVLSEQPRVKLHLVGTDYRPTIGAVPVRWTNWAEDPADYYRNLDFDVGLAPLADQRFNRAKSHIKALEYAALGIPVIATDMEPYHDFVIDGVTGFLVRSKAQWRDRLHLLARDDALRESMGAKAKARAAEWTIEQRWRDWDRAYRTLL